MAHVTEYLQPRAVEEAVQMKERYGARAFYLAGGTDAVIFESPTANVAIDIMGLDLNYIRQDDGTLRIGSTARLRDIERNPNVLGLKNRGFLEAVRETGPWLIRNQATLTGNICNASPSADSAPMLLALDAEVTLSDGRTVELAQFFTGPHKTILNDELVTEISIHPRQRRCHFHKHSRSKSDIAQVNLSVSAAVSGRTVSDVRVALGSVGPRPIRAFESERLLEGQEIDPPLLDELVERIQTEIQPIDDWRSSARYRRHAVGVLVRRAIEALIND